MVASAEVLAAGDCNLRRRHRHSEKMRHMLSVAIESGNVVLASGGEHAKLTVARGYDYHKPHWMPKEPQVIRDAKMVLGMPLLRFWHASMAKNTSHMCGIHCFGEDTCLVNLDCDQIVPLEYLRCLLKLYTKHSTLKGWTATCGQVAGQLLGRVAYRAVDWLYLGGYDEFGTPPSGGQDVDMRSRFEQWGAEASSATPNRSIIVGEDICGGALPNDFENTTWQHDRGWSKVKNVDPAVLNKFRYADKNKMWISMNEHGWRFFYGPRLAKKQWIRNKEVVASKAQIGAWFIVTEQHILPRGNAQRETEKHTTMARTRMRVDGLGLSDQPSSSNPSLPRAISLGSCAVCKVEIVVVPGVDLVNRKNTENTRLGLDKSDVSECV